MADLLMKTQADLLHLSQEREKRFAGNTNQSDELRRILEWSPGSTRTMGSLIGRDQWFILELVKVLMTRRHQALSYDRRQKGP